MQKATSRVSVHVNKEQSKRKKMSVQLETTTERKNCLTGVMETLRFIHIFICMCIPILQYTHTVLPQF